MYSLSTQGLTYIKNAHASTHLSGSSYYKEERGKIVRRIRAKSNPQDDTNLHRNYIEVCKIAHENNLPLSSRFFRESAIYEDKYAEYIDNYRYYEKLFKYTKRKSNNTFKLNKSKVRKKISAFCRLDASKKFLAFYSISLPFNTSDDVAYIIFNKWLTNLRSNYGLKHYIWVAERQANKTIHFHLLTNNYLDITSVNRAMARAINTEVNKGNASWGNSCLEKYNGVDVDSPQRPKRRQGESRSVYRKRVQSSKKGSISHRMHWIGLYMSKYVSKNNDEYHRLPYHSSRSVSRLFTSHVINDVHIDEYIHSLPDCADDYHIFENEDILHYGFKFVPECEMFEKIDRVNNIIFYDFDYEENTTRN